MNRRRAVQEEQYAFPYHHIPSWENDEFSQVRYWSWGFHYLGGIRLVLEQLEGLPFDSLVDFGCGDGRFLEEVARRHPSAELLGVDHSERAIAFARAFSPDLEFRAVNLIDEGLDDRFDVVTCIEVLEHIPPPEVEGVVQSAHRCLTEGGHLIVTVPHVNKPVNPKHFQHFSSDSLTNALRPHFEPLRFIPFDRRSRWVRPLATLIGGKGEIVVVTWPPALKLFFHIYHRYFGAECAESECTRIAVVAKKVEPRDR